MKKYKIIFQHPAIAHYRAELFRLLYKSPDIEIKLILNRENTLYPAAKVSDSFPGTTVLDTDNNKGWRKQLFHVQMKSDYDCIIATLPISLPSILALIATFIRRKPLILWSETWRKFGDPAKNKPAPVYWLKNLLYRFIVRRSSALLVPGTSAKEFHIQSGVKPEKIFIANQSASPPPFCEAKNIHIRPKESSEKILLFSGRLMKFKGATLVIKAFARVEGKLENLRLVIIGDGPCADECRNLIDDLKLQNIEFVGAIPYEDLYPYWQLADAFVIANTGDPYSDAWGIVFNEALSMGLPVICTEYAGAVEDLVKDGYNGIVVDAGDPEKLAEAIVGLFEDDAKMKIMGQRSREIYHEFNNYEKMAKAFTDAVDYVMVRDI